MFTYNVKKSRKYSRRITIHKRNFACIGAVILVEFLWSGESAFCRFGHHMDDLEPQIVKYNAQNLPVVGTYPTSTSELESISAYYDNCNRCYECSKFTTVVTMNDSQSALIDSCTR